MNYYKKLKICCEIISVIFYRLYIIYGKRNVTYHMVLWPCELLLIENNFDGNKG